MNKQERINQTLKLLSNSYRLDKNSIRVNSHNNLTHELAKFLKCFELIKEGNEIYTEAIFRNGKRCDILIPFRMQVIEILDTETEKKALEKIKKYPEQLDIICVKAKDIIKEIKVLD